MIELPKSMDDVEPGGDFKLLPDGEYKFEVKAAEVVQTKKGDDMLKVRSAVVDDDEYTGVCIFDQFVLVEQCLWSLKAFEQSLGMSFGDGFDETDLIGEEFTAVIKTDNSYKNADGEVVPKNAVKNYVFD